MFRRTTGQDHHTPRALLFNPCRLDVVTWLCAFCALVHLAPRTQPFGPHEQPSCGRHYPEVEGGAHYDALHYAAVTGRRLPPLVLCCAGDDATTGGPVAPLVGADDCGCVPGWSSGLSAGEAHACQLPLLLVGTRCWSPLVRAARRGRLVVLRAEGSAGQPRTGQLVRRHLRIRL